MEIDVLKVEVNKLPYQVEQMLQCHGKNLLKVNDIVYERMTHATT